MPSVGSEVELGKAPKRMAPNKSYCSVSENRNGINKSVTKLNFPNRNSESKFVATSMDKMPFIAKQRISPFLWMRESFLFSLVLLYTRLSATLIYQSVCWRAQLWSFTILLLQFPPTLQKCQTLGSWSPVGGRISRKCETKRYFHLLSPEILKLCMSVTGEKVWIFVIYVAFIFVLAASASEVSSMVRPHIECIALLSGSWIKVVWWHWNSVIWVSFHE